MRSTRRGNRILYLKDGVILGVCRLGKYVHGDEERHQKLAAFLEEMGRWDEKGYFIHPLQYPQDKGTNRCHNGLNDGHVNIMAGHGILYHGGQPY